MNTTQPIILVVDDETAVRNMLSFALRKANFTVNVVADANSAEKEIATKRPDLILLDWIMPGTTGAQFARQLRHQDHTRDIPIIMLTAKGEEQDVLDGFGSGADDYVTKPFSMKELLARINAVLKRSRLESKDEVYQVSGLKLDSRGQRLYADNEELIPGPIEFRLLQYFMRHPDQVFTRRQLLDGVWGTNVYVEERTVDVHIRRLRKLLESSGYQKFIQTVHGSGYRFSEKIP